MDVSKAIKKGRDAAFTFYGSFLGLFVISFLLFSLIDADARDAFREMNEVFQHIFYSFLVLVFSCYVLGGLMGRYYYYDHWNPVLVGIVFVYLSFFLIILTGTVTELVLIRQYSSHNEFERLIEDYFLKPAALTAIVGLIPALLLGTVLGGILVRKK